MTTGDDHTTDGDDNDVPKLRLVRQDGKPVEEHPPVENRRKEQKPGKDPGAGGPRSRHQRANTRRLGEYFLANGWSQEVRFNMMAEHIEVRSPPWLVSDWLREGVAPGSWRLLHDADLLEATVMLQQIFPSAGVEGVLEGLRLIGHRGAVHPVRDYLAPLVWDGVPRLHKLFTHYFKAGLPTDPQRRIAHIGYLESTGVCFGVGAVARVEEPGCKLDNSVVMIGDQSLGKSTGVKALSPFPELFTDDVGRDVGARDTKMSLAAVWLIEFAEGEQLANETKTLKAFLSRQVDRFRLPYARLPINKKRQSVFIITANELELSDVTGNRRYWPFKVIGVDVEAIIRDRDQLWAEAFELYRRGERWWLTPTVEKIAAEEQALYEADPDPLIGAIRPWVEQQTGFFTMADLLKDALKLEVTDSRAINVQQRVAKLLEHELGCCRARPKSGPRRDQRVWRRDRV